MLTPFTSRSPNSVALRLLTIILAISLTSCGWKATSPDEALPGSGRLGTASTTPWWREVGGQPLDRLIREALASSPTVERLAARVELARADAKLLLADASPMVRLGSRRAVGRRQDFETSGQPADVMPYAGEASFAWEMDFWGRIRQLRQGSQQQIRASQADEAAGRLVLIAEIATLDVARRRLYHEETLVAEALASTHDSTHRLEEKARVGILDASAVERQKAESERLRRESEEIRRQRRLSELALDRLLGREPGIRPWPAPPHIPDPPKPPASVPSTFLANRPDIHAAAARVSAAWHLSQAATLDLLPKVTIRALAGGRTLRLTPSIEEWIAQVAPTLEVPLWDPERLAQQKRRQREASLAAIALQENTLRALEEVQAALTNLHAQATIETSAQASTNALRQVYDRTQERFQAGLSSQLEVLEDQRSVLASERASVKAREARMLAWVAFKKATGG